MSIITNNIISSNISSIESIIQKQSEQIQNLTYLYSSQNNREYDQVTKQKADISYDEINKRYRFQISKPENPIYIYQVWKKNNEQLNKDRKFFYESLRDWINSYKIQKEKYNFTPTTLIEINGSYFPTVLVDIIIENDYCVLYFDNSTISSLQVMEEMPKFGNSIDVRFDIDFIDITDNRLYNSLSNLNISQFIGTYGSNYIELGIRSNVVILQTFVFNIPEFVNNNLPTVFTCWEGFLESSSEIIVKTTFNNIDYYLDITLTPNGVSVIINKVWAFPVGVFTINLAKN